MADGYCKVTILGNLGDNAELRYGQSGTAVLKMRVAVNSTYLDKDKVRREKTSWYSAVCFGKRAEGLSKILTKGTTVFIEGDLETRSYDDKEGQKRWVTEIVAREIIPCGGKRPAADDSPPPERGGYRRENSAPRSPSPEPPVEPPADDYDASGGGGGGLDGEDDIPFVYIGAAPGCDRHVPRSWL